MLTLLFELEAAARLYLLVLCGFWGYGKAEALGAMLATGVLWLALLRYPKAPFAPMFAVWLVGKEEVRQRWGVGRR